MLMLEVRFRSRRTQYDLSIMTGIPQSRLSLIERGYVIPSQIEKDKIETALGWKVDWNGTAGQIDRPAVNC